MITMALCLSLGPACAPVPDVDPAGSEAQDPAAPPTSSSLLAAPADVIAWTVDGAPALVDGTSGVIRQTLPAAVGSGDRDMAWDRWSRRLVIVQGDEGGEGGEIASHPHVPARTGFRLGERVHEAWIDGRVRVLPSPFGVVVMEESYGTRFRLLGPTPTPSVAAPPPAAAWLTVEPAGAVLHALAAVEDPPAFEVRTASVTAAGVSAPHVQPLAIGPASTPPTARLVPGPSTERTILVDVSGASLVVRLVDDAGAGPASTLALPSSGMRIEAAVSLCGGSVVAMLMSGTPQILAVSVDPSGAVTSAAHLPLPGAVSSATHFFSRDLVVQGHDRLLAATSAGVHAVRVTQNGNAGLYLAFAEEFAGSTLRGPIAVVEPSPE